MPYQEGTRLPGEFGSKTSHIDIVNNKLVKDLINTFESRDITEIKNPAKWSKYNSTSSLTSIHSVDGSYQIIRSDDWPYKKIGFVKVSRVALNNEDVDELDPINPHPMMIRDIFAKSSCYHATILPLQHIKIRGMTAHESIRNVIYDSMKDDRFDGEILNTLKWLVYEKWSGKEKGVEFFKCPHCNEDIATLPYDADEANCSGCKNKLFITDMLGFHLDTNSEGYTNEVIVNSYMSIIETLILFVGIKYFWENKKQHLQDVLFLKDGPLSIRAQYSKLIVPIRRFLAFARDNKNPIYIAGQEKTGIFVDHLAMIERNVPSNSIFIPDDNYIKLEIQQRSLKSQIYGKDTNYGNKVFLKITDRHSVVLSIPTGGVTANPTEADLIGSDKIFKTLNLLLSSRHESGLIPIEMAHNIASLSTYPSAKLLKLLAEEAGLI